MMKIFALILTMGQFGSMPGDVGCANLYQVEGELLHCCALKSGKRCCAPKLRNGNPKGCACVKPKPRPKREKKPKKNESGKLSE